MTAVTSTPLPAATRWTIDKVHSSVGFAVKHMVVSTYRGQFDDFFDIAHYPEIHFSSTLARVEGGDANDVKLIAELQFAQE